MRMRDLPCLESIATTSIFAVYFLPSFIAFLRAHKNRFAIFLINLLLGWTVLGWVWALVWSLTICGLVARKDCKTTRWELTTCKDCLRYCSEQTKIKLLKLKKSAIIKP